MPEALAPIKLGRDTARRSLAFSVGAASGILAAVGKGAGRCAGWFVRQFRARPTSTVAGAVFAALMVGVGLNALVLQKARHPAPLFDAPVQDAQAPAAAAEQSAAARPAADQPLDPAPTGTLPPNAGADAPAPPVDQPAEAMPPAAPVAPAAREAADDTAAPKPAKKRHKTKTAAKKSKGHDKISQFLKEEKPSKRHRHKSNSDE